MAEQSSALIMGPQTSATSIPVTPPPPSTAVPRPPAAPTLQEAFRWSLEARGDAGVGATQPLSEEDAKFLRGALTAMEGNSDETKVRLCIFLGVIFVVFRCCKYVSSISLYWIHTAYLCC
jgi:hypothetical protein